MRTYAAFVGLALGALGGCASIPDIPEEEYVKVADVLYTTECELKEAIDALSREVKVGKQLIQVIYRLNVVETGKGSAGAGVVVPISNGTFSLGLAVGSTHTNSRKTSFTVEYLSPELRCVVPEGVEPPQRLEGDLGLGSWLLRTASTLSSVDETPTAMTYEVGFNIVRNAELKPAIGLAFADGHKFGADLALTGSRETEHVITVTAAKIDSVSASGTAEAKRNLNAAVQQFLLRDSN